MRAAAGEAHPLERPWASSESEAHVKATRRKAMPSVLFDAACSTRELQLGQRRVAVVCAVARLRTLT